jgi:hypothetical protein
MVDAGWPREVPNLCCYSDPGEIKKDEQANARKVVTQEGSSGQMNCTSS